jgi:hypothetical protein
VIVWAGRVQGDSKLGRRVEQLWCRVVHDGRVSARPRRGRGVLRFGVSIELRLGRKVA